MIGKVRLAQVLPPIAGDVIALIDALHLDRPFIAGFSEAAPPQRSSRSADPT